MKSLAEEKEEYKKENEIVYDKLQNDYKRKYHILDVIN